METRHSVLVVFCLVLTEVKCFTVNKQIDSENAQIDVHHLRHRRDFTEPYEEIPNIAVTTPTIEQDTSPLDSWSVIWYIASFGGLIAFFLIVSCSEWCCRRAVRNQQGFNRNPVITPNQAVPETPPPSYDHFAPPSYDSITLGRNNGEKSEYDIYVVPVHALGTLVESTEDAPPSYQTANYLPTPRT